MKKMLLFAVAATLAVGASAQLVAKKLPTAVKKQNMTVTSPKVSAPQLSVMPMQQASEQTVEQRRAAIKRANGQAKAWYNRPAGAFYVGMTKTGGTYYSPMFILPVYREVTFPNASENASSYEWAYKNYVKQAWDSIVVNDVDLKVAFNWIAGDAPILTADNEDQYMLYNYDYDDSDEDNPVTTKYYGAIQSLFDPFNELVDDGYNISGFSPKFFAAGDRVDGTSYGTVTYTGAKDANGGTGGYWFGKNYSGYNGMAIYCEKPENPYNLRGVNMWYHNLAWVSTEAGEQGAEITARVYAVNEHSADTLALGKVLAEGKAMLNSKSTALGCLPIVFSGLDEDGLPYEYSLDVDQEIAVVVSGYDSDNIKTFCMRISGDEIDEGYGYIGYMLRCDEDGTPTWTRELNNFFTSPLGYTAPTIFLDIEYPYMEPVYNYEDTYTFPAEGGAVTFNGVDENNQPLELVGYDFQSNKTAELFEFIDENGEYPEWLTFEAKDVDYNEQYVVNQVNVTVKAEPLPEGVAGRVAKMKIGVPGGFYKVKFVQGEVPADEFYVSGDFNEWATDEALKMEEDEETGKFVATVEMEANKEFKIIVPDGDDWKWYGGIDENQVGYFEINAQTLNVSIDLVDGSNFRVVEAGEYTLTVDPEAMTIVVTKKAPEFLVGDVNGDGEVGIADLTMLVSLVMEGTSNERSDVNGDGETGVADVTFLVNILLNQGN